MKKFYNLWARYIFQQVQIKFLPISILAPPVSISISAGKYAFTGFFVVVGTVVGGGDSIVKFPFAGAENKEQLKHVSFLHKTNLVAIGAENL